MNVDPKDANRGLYHKFQVTRTDGRSAPGERHERCFYFVLDCDHDPCALEALKAYANACQWTHPFLARDLWHLVANIVSRAQVEKGEGGR